MWYTGNVQSRMSCSTNSQVKNYQNGARSCQEWCRTAISGKLPEWYMIHIPLLAIAYGKMCHCQHIDKTAVDGTNINTNLGNVRSTLLW